jgi:hypothetical protein
MLAKDYLLNLLSCLRSAMSKLIFLIGAPSSKLNWDEAQLLKTCVPPFEWENKKVLDQSGDTEAVYFNTRTTVKWRSLSNQRSSPLRHTLSDHSVDDTLFLQDADLVTERHSHLNNTNLSQFYEHSISFHDTTGLPVSETPGVDSNDESGSWEGDSQSKPHIAFQLPVFGGLSDLVDIPNAVYLQSIIPQTMSVNLIVGILRVEQPRRIITRTGNPMDLVELLVGDDTRAGFRVTFWLVLSGQLTNPARSRDDHDTRASLTSLRPRDIVLLRTVGLSSFRMGVYGQSLRNGVSKVDLLHREALDESETCGIYSLKGINRATNNQHSLLNNPQLDKVLRVKEWLLQFVEIERHGVARDRRGMLLTGHQVPLDSQ